MHIEEAPFAKRTGPKLIAITGGIGSGKSFVCNILTELGYQVYDCDSRAKALMEADNAIKSVLTSEITPEAVTGNGSLNRKAIAEVVFNDPNKLAILDKAVHAAVLRDLLAWCERNDNERMLFVETAIPFKSNIYRIVDDIWEIKAPDDVRIARAIKRDNSTPEAINSRMSSQAGELPSTFVVHNPEIRFKTLLNDGKRPIDKEINKLLNSY